jgi:L-alanine-DL-glutamate epimerase-like enolase superfamily enzyme
MRIVGFELYRVDLGTRLPFQYGIATMTRVPEIFIRLQVQFDPAPTAGFSSDCLPPKWFTKIPEKPLQEELAEMLTVIQHALETAVGIEGESVFACWQSLYSAQERWANERHIPPLLAHFGTSLVERALIDAFCRARQMTFAQAMGDNSLKIDLGKIHSALRGKAPSDFLPAAPRRNVIVRHTVGLADPLTDRDIKERLNDCLPQSLQACARIYGLRHFKIKINGNLETDMERLEKIAETLRQAAPRDFRFSLDANEQFKSVAAFREYWQIIAHRDSDFFNRLLFVEQPLHRDVALQPAVEKEWKAWPDRPAIIVDESDGTLDAVPTALRLGYAGASHKNCKGIIKGIANACLLKHSLGMMTGEDLCNIGPVALLQDLAVMATLGIESVERNGHHYHAGLSQFPRKIQEQVLAHHGDLYSETTDGWPAVRITNGSIELGSVNKAPFGTDFLLDTTELKRIA